ncbi:MAG: malonyl-CoA decarboxylase family protein [Pseudomonadales bacterium]
MMAGPNFRNLFNRFGGAGFEKWRGRMAVSPEQPAIDLCHRLLRLRGEASAIVIADEIISRFTALDAAGQLEFFNQLLEQFQPEAEALKIAAEHYLAEPGAESAAAIAVASEAPWKALFRLLSTSPAGVPALIEMREQLLPLLREYPELTTLDSDLVNVFRSWFNRGFLELREIDWHTPAHILEKLIAYEAVHEIRGWDDLRRRLADDRRCFAFFHPALVDEPLVFVQVALTATMPAQIGNILDEEVSTGFVPPKTAVFYSISNCQEGLRGVSFGNFLIKQVLLELKREFPSIDLSVTLSPVPNFRRWVQSVLADEERQAELGIADSELEELLALDELIQTDKDKQHREQITENLNQLESTLMRLCGFFLAREKRMGLPHDAVARFHLSNGARLEQINWAGDLSYRRLRQSFGILVNYAYNADKLEENHEALVNDGTIAISPAVKKLANAKPTKRAA